jgi:hypothetical protein
MASPRNMDELKRAITYIELLTRSFETMKLLHYLLLSKPRTRFYLLWKFNFRNTISSPVSTLRLLLLSPLNSLVRSACPAYEPSTTMTQQTLLLSQAHTYTHTHTQTHTNTHPNNARLLKSCAAHLLSHSFWIPLYMNYQKYNSISKIRQ